MAVEAMKAYDQVSWTSIIHGTATLGQQQGSKRFISVPWMGKLQCCTDNQIGYHLIISRYRHKGLTSVGQAGALGILCMVPEKKGMIGATG
jgi:hypothetical protein